MKRIILLFIYILILCGCTFTPTINNRNYDEPKDLSNQDNPDEWDDLGGGGRPPR